MIRTDDNSPFLASIGKTAKILSKLRFSVRFQLANIHYFADDNSSGNYLAGGKWQSLKSVKIQGFMARLRRLERPTLRLGVEQAHLLVVWLSPLCRS